MDNIENLIEKITEHYESPIQIGSRCLANTYYRVEDLDRKDISLIARQIINRFEDVCAPQYADLIIKMPGTITPLAEKISEEMSDAGMLHGDFQKIQIIEYSQILADDDYDERLQGSNVIILSDVITTGRSCLESHSQATILGANVLCWACIIDRTFGPGPVPVIATWTGEPVYLIDDSF